MKHLNKSRTVLWLMVLLSSLSSFAQNSMVGDGFGGRAGYCPVNYALGGIYGLAVCGNNNQLYAWGDNSYYQFGQATPATSATPVAIPGMTNVIQFSPGYHISTAIKSDGTGWVWGGYSPLNYPIPTQVITDAYQCSAGNYMAYFVKKDGTVWAIGHNDSRYGNTTGPHNCEGPAGNCAEKMEGVTTAKRVSVGESVVLILLADGTVMYVGALGSTLPSAAIPTPISGLSNIVAIEAGKAGAFFLTNTGQVYTIDGTTTGPQLVPFPSGAAPIKALGIFGYEAATYQMALDENGNMYNWGQSLYGQLGNGTTIGLVTSPQLRVTNVRDMVAGGTAAYIVKNDGTTWVSGTGYYLNMNLSPTATFTTFTQMSPSAVGLCSPTPTCFTGMPPCVAGTTAPAVTPTTATNSCPTTTVNLASLAISSTTPSGASLIWSTHKTPTSAADTLTTAQKTAVSTAGTYYAMYYDATNACYSPADSVTITITNCVAPLTANTPAAQTATTGTAKTGNAATELAPTGGVSPYIYSNGAGNAACIAPSGATALTGLTVNANGSYSYTAPTTAGTYYYCIKVCDSATPTASCIVKTYTLTVSPPACTVTGITPTIIKN